jgi:hypothetical protein
VLWLVVRERAQALWHRLRWISPVLLRQVGVLPSVPEAARWVVALPVGPLDLVASQPLREVAPPLVSAALVPEVLTVWDDRWQASAHWLLCLRQRVFGPSTPQRDCCQSRAPPPTHAAEFQGASSAAYPRLCRRSCTLAQMRSLGPPTLGGLASLAVSFPSGLELLASLEVAHGQEVETLAVVH